MSVKIETRSVKSPTATEIYISAASTGRGSLESQAAKMFTGIRGVLCSEGAWIFQERVFATKDVMEAVRRLRLEAYGDIDDGVSPSFLAGKEGLLGPLSGVQVHAVIGENKPEVIELEGVRCGRIFRMPGRSYLCLSAISTPQCSGAVAQAQGMLEKSESVLKRYGCDILSVPRTWMWLGDILSWYDDFNNVRNSFFIEQGAIGGGGREQMPASTGIGLGPVNGASCSMDLTAVLEPKNSIQYLQAGGKQQSAFKYGSAFSRASRAVTPAGQTVFVSGTASIDASGATTNIADALAQIKATIENVRAVLRDMDCTDDDVVQLVAYCKTTEVEKLFNDLKDRFNWPWVTVICDICRSDLLFEIEAAAMTREKSR